MKNDIFGLSIKKINVLSEMTLLSVAQVCLFCGRKNQDCDTPDCAKTITDLKQLREYFTERSIKGVEIHGNAVCFPCDGSYLLYGITFPLSLHMFEKAWIVFQYDKKKRFPRFLMFSLEDITQQEIIPNCKLSIMQPGILPIWEDEQHIGGCYLMCNFDGVFQIDTGNPQYDSSCADSIYSLLMCIMGSNLLCQFDDVVTGFDLIIREWNVTMRFWIRCGAVEKYPDMPPKIKSRLVDYGFPVFNVRYANFDEPLGDGKGGNGCKGGNGGSRFICVNGGNGRGRFKR